MMVNIKYFNGLNVFKMHVFQDWFLITDYLLATWSSGEFQIPQKFEYKNTFSVHVCYKQILRSHPAFTCQKLRIETLELIPCYNVSVVNFGYVIIGWDNAFS